MRAQSADPFSFGHRLYIRVEWTFRVGAVRRPFHKNCAPDRISEYFFTKRGVEA
jgi:hypothetical protein